MDKDNMQTLSWPLGCAQLIVEREYIAEIPMIMKDIVTLESIELQQCCPSIITSAECTLESQHDAGNNTLENMKKKAGTTNNSEASKPKERHIVSWSQEEDDILREHIRVHGSDKQPALSEESAGSSEYCTGSTLLAHGVGDNREKSEAEGEPGRGQLSGLPNSTNSRSVHKIISVDILTLRWAGCKHLPTHRLGST
nr:transcriptional activator Myb [Ipomoea batatas]